MSKKVDIHDLFDNLIPLGCKENPSYPLQVGHIYKFDISGQEGGQWIINFDKDQEGPYCLREADLKKEVKPECVISLSDDDFQKLHEAPQANGMQLFFSGKLKVEGNQMLLMKLQRVFEVATKR